MIVTRFRLMAVLLLMLEITACGPAMIDPKKVKGEYAYKYSTGEIEILKLATNLTYQHELYEGVSTYRTNGKPNYVNLGSWSYSKRVLTMSNWLSFCEYPDPQKRLNPPARFSSIGVQWIAPSIWGDDSLMMSPDFHYYFRRVKNGDIE